MNRTKLLLVVIAAASALHASCDADDGGRDVSVDGPDADTATDEAPDTPADTPDGDAPDTPTGFCDDLADGLWCDGDDLVECAGGIEVGRETCPLGCWTMDGDAPDFCIEESVCIDEPSTLSPDPPIEVCNFMDWRMSSDGHYLISQFGTTNDPTTLGHTTSCGHLQNHYNGRSCMYDVRTSSCLSDTYEIPWVYGDVDWDYDTVIAAVDAHMGTDVPYPEYFYVACAQRFNCGTLLRVTNTENGLCVVVYVEDGGPGATYEDVDYGERRILDCSPAVVRYLEVDHIGWLSSTMMYVEWGLPGDVPGEACTRCESNPAAHDYPWMGSVFDINHMMSITCREDICGDGLCGATEDHLSCPEDCPVCGPVPRDGRIVDETDTCYTAGGSPGYWNTETAGHGGSLMWTHTTDSSSVDNHGIWRLDLEEAGTYLVEAYTDAAFAESTQAAYDVTHDGATDSSTIDQTSTDGWNTIGEFHFAAGTGQWVRLDDNTGEPFSGRTQIVFDAIRLTRTGP